MLNETLFYYVENITEPNFCFCYLISKCNKTNFKIEIKMLKLMFFSFNILVLTYQRLTNLRNQCCSYFSTFFTFQILFSNVNTIFVEIMFKLV